GPRGHLVGYVGDWLSSRRHPVVCRHSAALVLPLCAGGQTGRRGREVGWRRACHHGTSYAERTDDGWTGRGGTGRLDWRQPLDQSSYGGPGGNLGDAAQRGGHLE